MQKLIIDSIFPHSNSLVTITIKELAEGGFCFFDDEGFPIWEESHRPELEKKIIEHYWMRQIGFETPGRFKFELNKKLREIMPYYVELYKTTKFQYNPIENYNMNEDSEDISKNTSNENSENVNRFSETPQGRIENLDDGFLTSATKDTGKNDSSSNGELKHTAARHGNIGVTSTQQLITQERELILNIDMRIVEELNVLFLGVY